MGGCCSRGSSTEGVVTLDLAAKPAGEHVSSARNRRCTDVVWLVLFALCWVVYVLVTVAGVSSGDPAKLFKPRDFQGAYCGLESQWNGGPDLADKSKQSFTMNVSAVTHQIATQLLCSSATSSFLLGDSSPLTTAQKTEYACACCLFPCASCTGSLALGKGGDVASAGALRDTVASRMDELTSIFGSPFSFFDPAGFNGDFASHMWREATKYFVKVCLPSCNAGLELGNRSYTYKPSADSPLRVAWDELGVSSHPEATQMRAVIASKFTFTALPESVCPYAAAYCVPFPGVEFAELVGEYCRFEMSAGVKDAIGEAAAIAMASLGGEAFAEASTETLGTWMGDFEVSIDSFVIVSMLAFVVGLVFMVLLRFCIRPCLWLSVLMVLVMLLLGGGIVFVRSGQCADAGLFESGRRVAVAISIASARAVVDAITGQAPSNEGLVGDGSGYVGVQARTRSGTICKAWADVGPEYWPVLREKGHLRENFCRNPYNESSVFQASTIWCFTTNTEKLWELCAPLGVLQPECEGGYAVKGQTARGALRACAIALWSLSLLWFLLVCCCCSRISLAVALNKVAAQFLTHIPQVLLVPTVGTLVSTLWVLAWVSSACFLLSQVPDGYSPKLAYGSYAEAYGTAETPGECTGRWPAGSVWKDETCSGEAPKCWRCAPPRYVLDVRIFMSLFVFLWTNAFLVALGQCSVAGAAGIWFFTPNGEKGRSGRPGTVRLAVHHCFRFHMGSLAFGAFILALVKLLRYMLMFFEKHAAAQKNHVVVLLARCLQCAVWCLEKFIKFLNRNAYIQVALKGTSFCASAKRSWEIISKNLLRFGVVAVLGRLISVVGSLFIMAVTTILGYFVLKGMHPEVAPVVPLVVFLFISYIVSRLFMSVFGMAADTCLQCVITAEEEDHVGGCVPEALQDLLQVRVEAQQVRISPASGQLRAAAQAGGLLPGGDDDPDKGCPAEPA